MSNLIDAAFYAARLPSAFQLRRQDSKQGPNRGDEAFRALGESLNTLSPQKPRRTRMSMRNWTRVQLDRDAGGGGYCGISSTSRRPAGLTRRCVFARGFDAWPGYAARLRSRRSRCAYPGRADVSDLKGALHSGASL